MAEPASNRSRLAGFSFVLFCVSLLLMSYSRKNPGLAGMGSAWLAEIESPLQIVGHATFRGVRGVWDNYIALMGVKEELAQSKQRLSFLEAENSSLLELESENKRLRSLLSMADQTALSGVAAEVIGYDPSAWVRAITVNKGTRDGIKVGMPVLAGNGLVGQVTSAASQVSRILLIIDNGSGVDALIQEGRARGIVAGVGEDLCEMRYVLREEKIKVGDRIITSGLDGVYPKGLFVGVVSEQEDSGSGLFRSVFIKPAVKFAKLETVLIVTSAIEAQEKLIDGQKK